MSVEAQGERSWNPSVLGNWAESLHGSRTGKIIRSSYLMLPKESKG